MGNVFSLITGIICLGIFTAIVFIAVDMFRPASYKIVQPYREDWQREAKLFLKNQFSEAKVVQAQIKKLEDQSDRGLMRKIAEDQFFKNCLSPAMRANAIVIQYETNMGLFIAMIKRA